jgi:hypothetical protein
MSNVKTFENFLLEKKGKYEYQVRDIDGNVYYKRKVGSKLWEFTDEKDFNKNINDDNVIQWLPSLKTNKKQ